jgi:UDP-N-acetylglucosamine 2-epimerase
VIHIALGTKAQFIKMAPIVHRLEAEGIPYRLIDLGQHALITEHLRREFGIREPEVFLSKGVNVARLGQGIWWTTRLFARGLDRRQVRREVFGDEGGYCLIHGDTVSTVIALWLAKRAGLRVAHVEAGLRSYNMLQPFPEELVRLVVMHSSDLLFAPSEWAYENLQKMGLGAKSRRICANTSWESCAYSLAKREDTGLGSEPYALITTHRLENIFSRRRMEILLEMLERITRTLRVVFVQHQPTIARLEELGLRPRLESLPRIEFRTIQSHAGFVSLVAGSSFVITDGGSIQEECFYLNKPCLILRSVTERREGLGENAELCTFDRPTIERFLSSWTEWKRTSELPEETSPSEEILRHLQDEGS